MFKLLPIDNEVVKLIVLIQKFNEWIDKYNAILVEIFLKIAKIEGDDVFVQIDDINEVLAKKKENVKEELHNKLQEILNVKYEDPVVVVKEKKKRVYQKKVVEEVNDDIVEKSI